MHNMLLLMELFLFSKEKTPFWKLNTPRQSNHELEFYYESFWLFPVLSYNIFNDYILILMHFILTIAYFYLLKVSSLDVKHSVLPMLATSGTIRHTKFLLQLKISWFSLTNWKKDLYLIFSEHVCSKVCFICYTSLMCCYYA